MTRPRGRGTRRPAARKGRRGDRPEADAMEDLRRRIDLLDRRLVSLLNDRAECALALGRIKKERSLPIYQPAREQEVLGNVQRTNGGPLQSEAVRRLFERIIDESRRIERIATGGEEERAVVGGRSPDPAGPADPQD